MEMCIKWLEETVGVVNRHLNRRNGVEHVISRDIRVTYNTSLMLFLTLNLRIGAQNDWKKLSLRVIGVL